MPLLIGSSRCMTHIQQLCFLGSGSSAGPHDTSGPHVSNNGTVQSTAADPNPAFCGDDTSNSNMVKPTYLLTYGYK